MRSQRVHVVAVVVALGVLGAACGSGDSGDGGGGSPRPTGAQADDAELVEGRSVYVSSCVACHGVGGGGGTGPQLADGRVVDRYPDIADQIAVIADGRGGMPSFSGDLTDAQIRAVARYEREVL